VFKTRQRWTQKQGLVRASVRGGCSSQAWHAEQLSFWDQKDLRYRLHESLSCRLDLNTWLGFD
jgi:hypothetical protein